MLFYRFAWKYASFVKSSLGTHAIKLETSLLFMILIYECQPRQEYLRQTISLWKARKDAPTSANAVAMVIMHTLPSMIASPHHTAPLRVPLP